MKLLICISLLFGVLTNADKEEHDNSTISKMVYTARPKLNNTVNPHATPQHVTRGHHKGLVKSYQDCFGMTPEFHGKDKHCIFPFIYRGIVYETCTYIADSQPWCATGTDENGHLVSNDWGYCTAECPVMPHTHCRTVKGGPIEGAFCRFPFRYKDVEYNMCTRVDHHLTPDAVEAGVNATQGWCATKVDAHGDYVPHHWGICQVECRPPKTEKTIPAPTSTTITSTETSSESTTTPMIRMMTSTNNAGTSSETTSTMESTSTTETTPTTETTSTEELTSTMETTSATTTATATTSTESISVTTPTEIPGTPGGGDNTTTTISSTTQLSPPLPEHIPFEQLPVLTDTATYIPRAYSDPIRAILVDSGIEIQLKQEL